MKQRYDSYKPSSIDWIGDIPSHWTVCRIKDCFILKTGTTPKGFDKPINDNEINWFTPSDINSTGTILHEAERKLSENLINREGISLFPQKSLIFVGIGATAGKLGYAEVAGYSNQQITGLIPKSCCSKYYFYYLCHDSKRVRDNASFTTLPIINNSYLSQVYWVMPPLAEQEAIAGWLDEKCGEIDAAIAKVDREIELIDELKQSEISRVVTHGLNPDAPLHPSGIDWINEIPVNWSSMKLKHTVKNIESDFMDGDWIESTDISTEGIRYLTSGNIGAGFYKEQGEGFISEDTFAELDCIEVFPGDLLISRLNEPIARTCFIPNLGYRIVTCVDNVIYRPKLGQFDKRFMMYQLNSKPFWFNASQLSSGATMQRISRSKLGSIKIIVPPLSEQQAIADYLDKKCAEIDGLKEKLTKKRETLTELRQSIISEVVTGKRKVI